MDEEAAAELDQQKGTLTSGLVKAGQQRKASIGGGGYHGNFPDCASEKATYGDSGVASRFFYTTKASRKDAVKGMIIPQSSL